MGADLIMVNYRTADDAARFVYSVLSHPEPDWFTVWLVDVDPTDRKPCQELVDLLLREGVDAAYFPISYNAGYGKAVNMAVNQGKEPIIGIFNADTQLVGDAAFACENALEANSDWGIVGPKQIDANGSITHAGIFGTQIAPKHRGWKEPDRGQYADVEEAIYISGSAFFMRREVWYEMSWCPEYRAACPEAFGALLETPHYYEESWLCLPGDSMIWAPSGPKRISEVAPGDSVYGFNEESRSIEVGRVSESGPTGRRRVLEVSVRGRRVRVTENHPVLVAEGVHINGKGGSVTWKKAGDLDPTDCLVVATDLPVECANDNEISLDEMTFWGMYVAARFGLEGVAVRRIESIEDLGEMEVYDLTVPGLGSFVADGVVVHNCNHLRHHGYKVIYKGDVTMIHEWHRSSPLGGHADRQMPKSKEIFREANRIHGIECE